MLAFAPPFVESYGVVLEGDAGLDAAAVPRIVDDEVESHETLVVVGIGPAKLADEGIEDLEGVDMQRLLLDDHPVDTDGVVVEPRAHPEGHGTLSRI